MVVMGERINELDDRFMDWISHTNQGVAVGLILCFALLTAAIVLFS